MLTVKKETKAYEPTVFFEHLVYKVSYWVWHGGIIPDGPGAYANNAPVHKDQMADTLKKHGMFCAAVPNIYRRMAGLEVPHKGLPNYDGDIAAYFTGVFGKSYFSNVDVGFNLKRASCSCLAGMYYSPGSVPGFNGRTPSSRRAATGPTAA